MQLAVDASSLIGELLRQRGRILVAHQELELYITERVWSEVDHELPIRIGNMDRHGHLAPGQAPTILAECRELLASNIRIVPAPVYAVAEQVARRRIPRDPDDWPTVALALTLEAAIWTHDHDFLGCGIATWSTETLLLHLDA